MVFGSKRSCAYEECTARFGPMKPFPPARFAVVAALATVAVLGSLGLAALLGPPSSAAPPARSIVVGYERFYYETVTAPEPGWSNFSFFGVTFELHAWCSALTPGGTSVCGNATQPSGISFPFSFREGPPPDPTHPWQTWISPNGHEGVQFESDSGGLARLLVLA